ncbi:MAG TPA: helix-turn-helix domain-containing protein [Pyrinomonadaceae bacterium]|nr:helix-turn-helix domain-containing protein [Pyrinomonadaceae bacterium]
MNSKTSDQTPDGGQRPAGGADGSLGEQLRRAREARGVSLREISEQTRITMRHLEAIESDDYKHLPGGIFNKSFIKAYARHVRFDEARALELYERTARARGEYSDEVATTPQRSRIYTGDPSRSPMITAALSAVIVGILILIVYAGLHYYRRTESPADATPTPTPSMTGGAAATTDATQTPQPGATDALKVAIKSNNEVWLRVMVDDETARDNPGVVWPAGQTREFTPQQKLTLNYARSMTGAFDVTVNGVGLKVPAETRPGISQELVITRDNYRQYAQ